jgi:oxygen-dependent protoporphyrinogen oxidase
MPGKASHRVAVVGAGPAGLAAAHLLSRRGAQVQVYEKQEAPGGRSGCDAVGACRFDRGAQFVTSFYPRTLRLIRQFGLAGQLLPLRLEGDVLLDGQRKPLPVTPWLLLRSPLLSRRTKLALLALGPRLLWWRLRYRWTEMEGAAEVDDGAALDYFRRLLGEEYVRVLLGPTLESFLVSPAEETSRALAMIQTHEAVGARFWCVRGGMARLWETVAARVPVRYGVSVQRVALVGSRVTVQLSEGTETADAAIVAVPGPDAVELLPDDHAERALAGRSRYSAVVKLHVCLEQPIKGLRPVCLGGVGNASLAGVGTLEAKKSDQVPEGRGSLDAWTGPRLGRELIDAADDTVRARIRQEAETLLGFALPTFGSTSIVRLRCGLPVFYPGWLRLLQERRRSLTPGPITTAGDYLASPSVEGAIRTGEEAAERVLRWLAR